MKFDTFEDVCTFLGINDYAEEIISSNSRGQLFHLLEYFDYAREVQKQEVDPAHFRPLFLMCVDHAKENWKRPESVYQHIFKMLSEVKQEINVG